MLGFFGIGSAVLANIVPFGLANYGRSLYVHCMDKPKRYPEKMLLLLPSGWSERLDEQASRCFTSRNEFVRQVLAERLRANGVSLTDRECERPA